MSDKQVLVADSSMESPRHAARQSTLSNAWAIFTEEVVLLKWRALIPICLMCLGSYYIYDFPGTVGTGENSIEARFHAHGKEYNEVMNQALYSVYSWPNTILAVVGGLLIDKYVGLRKSMMLFAVLVMVGAIVVFVGILLTEYSLLIVGRVIFGLGGESLNCAQMAAVARWFRGRGMALAISLTIAFSRVGASLGFLISPKLAADSGVTAAAFAGIVACAFSVATCAFVVALDVFAARRALLPPESLDANTVLRLRDAFKFPLPYWVMCIICVGVYCSIYPFIGVAKNFFIVRYDIDTATATSYLSYYQIMCAVGLPIFGFILETVGRFTFWLVAAGVGFVAFHVAFLLASPPPLLMMFVLAFTYCFCVPAFWPAVPVVVPPALIGLAYGVMMALQNTGLAIVPLISGAILDSHTAERLQQCSANTTTGCTNSTSPPLPTAEGFQFAQYVFLGSAAVGLAGAVALFVLDAALHDSLLASSPAQRTEKMAAKTALLENNGDQPNIDV
jgi:MFS family permease